MKNKDLIKKLKEYNLDADVTLTDSEDITISFISHDSDGNELSEKTTNQIFIEGIDNYVECVYEYINDDYGVKWCSYYNVPCADVKDCYEFNEFDEV